MQHDDTSAAETAIARRYFSSFADDYHRAFEGGGANPLHRLINRAFRRKTFVLRTALVREALQTHGVDGKVVLDLGCGSGEVSIIAASLGAKVIGLDIVPEMVQIARDEARKAGVAGRTEFRTGNIFVDDLPRADVTMMVGVIEYYSDLAALLHKVCAATGHLLIIVDTRGPVWRRLLRYALARLKHFRIFYRSADAVADTAAREGFREVKRVPGHSYTFFAFQRSSSTGR